MRHYKAALLAGVICSAAAVALVAAPTVRAEAAKAAQTQDLHKIRDAIKAANDKDGSGAYEAIIPYLPEKLETVHEPRFPNDGVVEGRKLARSLPYEHRVHDAMLENRKMAVTFTIREPNEIVVKGAMTGRLRYDGSQLVHPVNMVWTFDHGKIVKIWVDASDPAIKDGYKRQHEAMLSPAVRPMYDEWMKVMKEP